MGWIDTTGLFGLEMLRSQTKVALTAGGSGFFFSKRQGCEKVTKWLLNGKEACLHLPERPALRQTGSLLRALYTFPPPFR